MRRRRTIAEGKEYPAKFTVFGCPEDYIEHLNAITPTSKVKSSNTDFYGDPWEQAINKLAHGSTEYLARAQELMNKMADANIFALHQPRVVNSMVGFMPNIPAWRSGSPQHMYNRQITDNPSNTTPIAIYVETLVSAAVSQDHLIKRGVAVLALVLALNSIRPVELYTISLGSPDWGANGTGGAVVSIPNKPIDLERASWMLCDPAYYRRLAFSTMCAHVGLSHSGSTGWPWESSPQDAEYEPAMRKLLDMQPDDVFLKGGHIFDSLMLDNPIQWVREQIAKHNGEQTDA